MSTNSLRNLRDFMFRGLSFEAEADYFNAGIRIGSQTTTTETLLMEEALSPFAGEALQMARVYALLFCFENSVRRLIQARLAEKCGSDWWIVAVPKSIRDFADGRKASALKDSWLEGESKELIQFVEFGHLADIVANRWTTFRTSYRPEHWLKQRMYELEKTRNFIAHNRLLLQAEFQRIYMYVADWNRMVGL